MIIVHYATGFFDTVECVSYDEASYTGDEDTVKNKPPRAFFYAAVIIVAIIVIALALTGDIPGATAPQDISVPDDDLPGLDPEDFV